MQLQEFKSSFNEVNSKLILCIAYLNQDDSFVAFNKEKLLPLAQFYPNDFPVFQLITLDN